MKTYIVFDCYRTLIYKKNLALTVQDFFRDVESVFIPLPHIERAYHFIYDRHKFKHPRFESAEDRKKFYINYNKELMRIIGFEISDNVALVLNDKLTGVGYICYEDTISTLQYFKDKKYPLVLLANWTDTLKTVLDNVGLSKYFGTTYSSHDLSIQKPDPKFFNKSLSSLLLDNETVYYIGDDYELDIVPARHAGLTPILLDRDEKYPEQIDCLKIKSLVDLKTLIF